MATFIEQKLTELREQRKEMLEVLEELDLVITALSGETVVGKEKQASGGSGKRTRKRKEPQKKRIKSQPIQQMILTQLQEKDCRKRDLLALGKQPNSVHRALKRLTDLGKIESYKKGRDEFVKLVKVEAEA